MDVYNSIVANAATHPHVLKSVNFILEQIRLHTLKGVALSFNGGKDCTVLLHLIRAAFAKLSGLSNLDGLLNLYFLIPDEFDDVTRFMEQTSKAYNFRIVNLDGSFRSALTSLLATHPIRAIFMGQRRDDPGSTPAEIAKSDPGWPEFNRLNPILDWTYAQVWEFLRMYHLPYCTLYDQGYTSLGSTSTTCRNPLLRRSDGTYAPAYELTDGSKERIGRHKPTATGSPRAGAAQSSDVPCTSHGCTCSSSLSSPSPATSSPSSSPSLSSSSSSSSSSGSDINVTCATAASAATCTSATSSAARRWSGAGTYASLSSSSSHANNTCNGSTCSVVSPSPSVSLCHMTAVNTTIIPSLSSSSGGSVPLVAPIAVGKL